MQSPFSSRLTAALPRFYWPLMALLCIAYAWRPLTGGDDVWAHSAIGRWIFENQGVPQQSLFLWGAPPIPWIYHSWLSQLSFYSLLSGGENFGPIAVVVFTSVVVAATFTLLWRAWSVREGGVSPIMAVIFMLAIYCSSLRFHPRPELFSALFLCLLLLGLSRIKGTPNWREVFGIGALFIVWANFHGGVAVGLVLLAATVICEIAQQRFTRKSWGWGWLLLIAVLAICINPYGVAYWQALRPVGGEMFQRIDEWKPFWKSPILNPLLVIGETTLVWIAFLSWAGNEKRRWAGGAWLLIMLALFIMARRHLWLLPITCLAVLAANSSTLSPSRLLQAVNLNPDDIPASRRSWMRSMVIGAFGLAIAFAMPSKIFSANWLQPDVPRKSVDFFLQDPGIAKTRVFNDYENSSYLQWRLGGKPPLYIDLLNAYPDPLIFEYLDIVSATARGRRLLEQRKIESVILRPYKPESPLADLAKYLDHNSRWRRVYRENDGTIWTRRKTVSPES